MKIQKHVFPFLVLTTIINSFSTPIIYTFNGTVGENGWTLQKEVGDPIEYQFLIDFSRPGESYQNDETTYYSNVDFDGGYTERFYVEVIGGDLLAFDGSYSGPRTNMGWNTFFDDGRVVSWFLSFTDDPYRNFVQVGPSAGSGNLRSVQNWQVGDVFTSDNEVHRGEERFYGDGSSAWLYSGLTLTSIVPAVASVPEPSTYLLVLIGIGSMIFFKIGKIESKVEEKNPLPQILGSQNDQITRTQPV